MYGKYYKKDKISLFTEEGETVLLGLSGKVSWVMWLDFQIKIGSAR